MKEEQKIKMEGGLIDTACILPMNGPNAAITYLDYAVDADTQPHLEGEIPMQTLSLSVFTKFVQAENHQVTSSIPDSSMKDMVAYHNIDATEMTQSVLLNEMRIGIEKRMCQKYAELGLANAESKKSKWFKWVEKTFKIRLPTYSGSAGTRLFALSNIIATDGRRGHASFAIVSRMMLTELMGDPRFHPCKENDPFSSSAYQLVGTVSNIKIYVSNIDQWNSDQIVIGRKPNANDPGVYYCEHSNEFQEMLDEISTSHKFRLLSRHAIIDVGNSSKDFYYTENLRIGKKPWWRKLFRL